jgi:hypothetical protein
MDVVASIDVVLFLHLRTTTVPFQMVPEPPPTPRWVRCSAQGAKMRIPFVYNILVNIKRASFPKYGYLGSRANFV